MASSPAAAALIQVLLLLLPLCLLLIMSSAAPAILASSPAATAELRVASREMQAANYYTFVMLLNMVQDRIPSNTAFFMPSDRLLSEVTMSDDKILEFLARHSVPSPILFDHLRYLPTGTLVPTNRQGYMLRVSNAGSKNYHLNDVQVTKPNICTAGTITCHGISGVLSMRVEVDSYVMGGGGGGGNCTATEASMYAPEPEPAPSVFHAEHADPFDTEKKKKVEKERGGQSPSKAHHHHHSSDHNKEH